MKVTQTLNGGDSELVIAWKLAYWSTFLLTFLVIPFFQIYHDSGEFDIQSKALYAIKVRKEEGVSQARLAKSLWGMS